MSDLRISRNRDKRDSVMMRAIVWTEGARVPTEHRVRNISVSGVGLDHRGELRRGDSIRVSIGQEVDIPATVAWVKPGSAGVRFDHPIDLAAARRRSGTHMPAQAGWIGHMSDAYRR